MPFIPTKLTSNLNFAWHFTIILCKDANQSDVTFELLHGKLYINRFGIWDWLFVRSLYKSQTGTHIFLTKFFFIQSHLFPSSFLYLDKPQVLCRSPNFADFPYDANINKNFPKSFPKQLSVIFSAMIYAITFSFIRAFWGTSRTKANLEMKGGV